MKIGLFFTYVRRWVSGSSGEQYPKILRYFLPEYITSLTIYSLPFILDSIFVGALACTPAYATLGITNNLMHFLIKIAEAFSIGTIVLGGQFNGRHEYPEAGRVLRDSFWINCILGLAIALALYVGAPLIFWWYGVPEEIYKIGIPFLRIRAFGVFCMFVVGALVGFLRGIKNTRTPMVIYVIGGITLILCDYCLIFGAWGFPALGFNGSAVASLIQSGVMLVAALLFIILDPDYRKYCLHLFDGIAHKNYIKLILKLVWPVAIDKATLAGAYIWLNKMLCPMGTCALASFSAVKDMERFAFLPAVAFAQIITFLVSNEYGVHHWSRIKNNIKRIILLASIMVFGVLVIFSMYTEPIMRLFDRHGEFSSMAAQVFPILSVLVFFDLLQLILSGALRGSGNVKIVMAVRLVIVFGFFVPISWMFAHMPIANNALKFMLIYGSFYTGNALMSILYIMYFRSPWWKKNQILQNTP